MSPKNSIEVSSFKNEEQKYRRKIPKFIVKEKENKNLNSMNASQEDGSTKQMSLTTSFKTIWSKLRKWNDKLKKNKFELEKLKLGNRTQEKNRKKYNFRNEH